MSNRFEEATSVVQENVARVIREKFNHLSTCTIEVVMDTKKRKAGGKFVLVKLVKSSPIVRHITADDTTGEGIDYILYLDKMTFDNLEQADKDRVIAHGLYHADTDFEKDIPYGVKSPTVQTFYEEIQDNIEDPRWSERLETIADQLYEAEAEQNRPARGRREV